MDALTEKGLRDFMATGVRPPVVEAAVIAVEDKPDVMFQLLTSLCAVGMHAKDLHYRAKGKEFYAVHLLSDLVYDATRLFDELNEVYYLGQLQTVPPRMADVSAKAAQLAGEATKCYDTLPEEDAILAALTHRCEMAAALVETCKSLAPKSGTNAVLDEISKAMLKSAGLLTRTEKSGDAATKYLSMTSSAGMPVLDESLAEHDKKHHPDGYKEGDSCKYRDDMKKSDGADKLEPAVEKPDFKNNADHRDMLEYMNVHGYNYREDSFATVKDLERIYEWVQRKERDDRWECTPKKDEPYKGGWHGDRLEDRDSRGFECDDL